MKDKQTYLICLLAFLFWGCSGPIAVNREISRVVSPDAAWDAVIFERNAGASTSFSTQVSIVKHQSVLPDDGGNVFIADCDNGAAPAASWGGPYVQARWQSTNTLVLSFDIRARVFKKQNQVGGIRIETKKVANDATHAIDAGASQHGG
jgi:hypothetical protein